MCWVFTKHFLYIISFDSFSNPVKLMLSLSLSWRKGNEGFSVKSNFLRRARLVKYPNDTLHCAHKLIPCQGTSVFVLFQEWKHLKMSFLRLQGLKTEQSHSSTFLPSPLGLTEKWAWTRISKRTIKVTFAVPLVGKFSHSLTQTNKWKQMF